MVIVIVYWIVWFFSLLGYYVWAKDQKKEVGVIVPPLVCLIWPLILFAWFADAIADLAGG